MDAGFENQSGWPGLHTDASDVAGDLYQGLIAILYNHHDLAL